MNTKRLKLFLTATMFLFFLNQNHAMNLAQQDDDDFYADEKSSQDCQTVDKPTRNEFYETETDDDENHQTLLAEGRYNAFQQQHESDARDVFRQTKKVKNRKRCGKLFVATLCSIAAVVKGLTIYPLPFGIHETLQNATCVQEVTEKVNCSCSAEYFGLSPEDVKQLIEINRTLAEQKANEKAEDLSKQNDTSIRLNISYRKPAFLPHSIKP